jgi:hypothetical protein
VGLRSPRCVRKHGHFGETQGIGAKMEVIESKLFTRNLGAGRWQEKKGTKNAEYSRYLIENKWCKNVSFSPLHDVHENTSTYKILSTILMKQNDLAEYDGSRSGHLPRFGGPHSKRTRHQHRRLDACSVHATKMVGTKSD